MAFGIVQLTRAKSGAYTARKVIPKDVREDFARLYGIRWEAKATFPAGLKLHEAKARHGEWVADIETRIHAIRADQRGEGISLTHKQANALAGEWYRSFLAQHEDNPGSPQRWEERFWILISLLEEHAPEDVLAQSPRDLEWTRDPEVRNGIRPVMAKEARTDEFLASRGLSLTPQAYTRWRSVFLDLEKHFEQRAASSITSEEAQSWAEGLVGPKRSARTVNEVWCSAASTVFGWSAKSRKLTSNPFEDTRVTQPRTIGSEIH